MLYFRQRWLYSHLRASTVIDVNFAWALGAMGWTIMGHGGLEQKVRGIEISGATSTGWVTQLVQFRRTPIFSCIALSLLGTLQGIWFALHQTAFIVCLQW